MPTQNVNPSKGGWGGKRGTEYTLTGLIFALILLGIYGVLSASGALSGQGWKTGSVIVASSILSVCTTTLTENPRAKSVIFVTIFVISATVLFNIL